MVNSPSFGCYVYLACAITFRIEIFGREPAARRVFIKDSVGDSRGCLIKMASGIENNLAICVFDFGTDGVVFFCRKANARINPRRLI